MAGLDAETAGAVLQQDAVLLETIAEPKECAIELMKEQTLRSLSTTVT